MFSKFYVDKSRNSFLYLCYSSFRKWCFVKGHKSTATNCRYLLSIIFNIEIFFWNVTFSQFPLKYWQYCRNAGNPSSKYLLLYCNQIRKWYAPFWVSPILTGRRWATEEVLYWQVRVRDQSLEMIQSSRTDLVPKHWQIIEWLTKLNVIISLNTLGLGLGSGAGGSSAGNMLPWLAENGWNPLGARSEDDSFLSKPRDLLNPADTSFSLGLGMAEMAPDLRSFLATSLASLASAGLFNMGVFSGSGFGAFKACKAFFYIMKIHFCDWNSCKYDGSFTLLICMSQGSQSIFSIIKKTLNKYLL